MTLPDCEEKILHFGSRSGGEEFDATVIEVFHPAGHFVSLGEG
jgi:hypothetical protein